MRVIEFIVAFIYITLGFMAFIILIIIYFLNAIPWFIFEKIKQGLEWAIKKLQRKLEPIKP